MNNSNNNYMNDWLVLTVVLLVMSLLFWVTLVALKKVVD